VTGGEGCLTGFDLPGDCDDDEAFAFGCSCLLFCCDCLGVLTEDLLPCGFDPPGGDVAAPDAPAWLPVAVLPF
jgi:hypothetical protein